MYTKFIFLFIILFFATIWLYILRANNSNSGDVLAPALNNSSFSFDSLFKKKPSEPLATSTILGTYVCTPSSGCASPATLVISDSQNVTLTTEYANGAEILRENGVWSIAQRHELTISLYGNANQRYDIPHIFSIETVTNKELSDFVFDSSVFKDWQQPTFLRQ